MKFIWIELVKFFKNNIFKIIIGTALISVLFVWRTGYFNNAEVDNNNGKSGTSELTLNSKPAHFRFYVENADGNAFTNNLLVEQYITRPQVLKEVSEKTDTQLLKIIEETENTVKVTYNASGTSNVLGVIKDNSTNMHELYVNAGNEKDNLNISDFYFDYIVNGNIPFLQDKKVYIIEESKINEYQEEGYLSFNIPATTSSNSLPKNIVIGTLLGATVTTGILVMLTFFSKKIRYSFSYSIREDDYFFLVDTKKKYQEELKQILLTPPGNHQIVVCEKIDSELNYNLNSLYETNAEEKSITESNSILEIKNPQELDRLIYIILEDRTHRSWYNDQRKIDRMYDIPTVVIQVNKNSSY